MQRGRCYSYILITYLIGIVVFSLFRVVNTLVYCFGAEGWPDFEGLYLRSLAVGWRFDTVVSCYLLALPLLMAIGGEVWHIGARAYHLAMHILTVTLYTLAFFVCAVDVPYFDHFYSRLNAAALNQTGSFGIILSMIVGNPEYMLDFGLFVVLAAGYLLLMRKVFRGCFHRELENLRITETKIWGWGGVIAAALLLGCFTGMRGRIPPNPPLRVANACFCGNAFLNQLGLNPVFTFVKSMEREGNPLALMGAGEAKEVYDAGPNLNPNLNPQFSIPQGTNVVVVIMESMSAARTGLVRRDKSLTPHLDSLMRGGLLFSRCFSAGIHTYNGVYSSLYSHPAIPAYHPMRRTFMPQMQGLPHQLRAHGYRTAFMMPHDEDYDNMRDFLHANAFDSVIGQSCYPPGEVVGTWGIPDHCLFDHVLAHCRTVEAQGHPWLTVVLTCSDHVPYVLPQDIPFTPKSETIEEKMTEYADWSLGRFMDMAARETWFHNTVFVFVADHGVAGESYYDIALSYHHVPLLYYAPSWISPCQVDRLALQTDLYPTLMGMLPYDYDNNTFGVDLLRRQREYAYFSSDDKISVLDTAWLYICQVKDDIEHLYHWCDTTRGDQIAQHRDHAAAMRRHAFGLIQHSYNMINQYAPLSH